MSPTHGLFSNARNQFPVMPNSVWTAGPHTFLCGDVIALWRAGALAAYVPTVDAVYTDPPWSKGNRQMFHTYAKVEHPTDSFDEFLRSIAGLLRTFCPAGRMAVEMGLAAQASFDTAFADFVSLGVQTCTYGHPPRPHLIYFLSGSNQQPPITIESSHGADTIRQCVAAVSVPGGTLLDPFCGQLVFAQEAIQQGLTVYGCELIPAKLAKGLVALSRHFPIECRHENILES